VQFQVLLWLQTRYEAFKSALWGASWVRRCLEIVWGCITSVKLVQSVGFVAGLQGVQQLLLGSTNVTYGVRLGIVDVSADTVVVLTKPQPHRVSLTGRWGGTGVLSGHVQVAFQPPPL